MDKLAAEKRKERLLAGDSPRDSKRGRYDSGDDSNDSDSGVAFKSALRPAVLDD